MAIEGKYILVSGLLVASVFILANKLLLPTTIQIMFQDGTTSLKEIPNVYTFKDSLIIAVSSFVGGTCIFYLLSVKSEFQIQGTTVQTLDSTIINPSNINVGFKPEPKILPGPAKETPSIIEPNIDKIEYILKIFKGNEQRVIKELFNVDEITQAELALNMNIPKSTLSRILADLEKRGLIIRYEIGMSKKVKLARTLKTDKIE